MTIDRCARSLGSNVLAAAAAAAFGGDFDFVAIKIPVQTTLELPLGLPLRSQLTQLATRSGPLD